MSEPKTVRLQINEDFAPMANKGDVVIVPVSRTGILKVKYWRRRLKDAETDNCVEILKDEVSKKVSKKAKPGADDQGVSTDAK